MRTSHLLPRDLPDIIFRAWLQLCWLARPTAFANIRKHLDLTQNEVGAALGATRITISGWESGRFIPIPENAHRYYNALLDKATKDGKGVSWLVDEIYEQIPELYDAIPKMHDARRYKFLRDKQGLEFYSSLCEYGDDLDKALDCVIEDCPVDEDNEAEKSYLSGVV